MWRRFRTTMLQYEHCAITVYMCIMCFYVFIKFSKPILYSFLLPILNVNVNVNVNQLFLVWLK